MKIRRTCRHVSPSKNTLQPPEITKKLPALSALPVILKHSHAKTHHPVCLQEIIMEVKADFSKQKVDLLVAIEQLQRAARNLKANELGRSATIFLTSSRFLDAEC